MKVRFIMEVAWQAHFVKNMFIRPTEEEQKNFKPDFIVYNASKAKVENYKVALCHIHHYAGCAFFIELCSDYRHCLVAGERIECQFQAFFHT